MTTTPAQPDRPADSPDADWLDVADAVGVTPSDPPRPVEPIHPSLRPHLSDANLDAVVSRWTSDVAHQDDIDEPIPFVVVDPTDHATCEGDDCADVICCCPGPNRCTGTVEQACPHHTLLCDDCRDECIDCRLDAAHDAGRF